MNDSRSLMTESEGVNLTFNAAFPPSLRLGKKFIFPTPILEVFTPH